MRPRTVAIVGAGFSGTIVAVNLLRRSRAPLRIVLVDRGQLGRGAAYARRDHPYLLNVPAGRMSASSSDPLEFLTFVRGRNPCATAEGFLPRELYGDYLESLLHASELAAAPCVELERLQGEVERVDRTREGASLDVQFTNHHRIRADEVVLALGNPPPAGIPGTQALHGFPRYAEDPWSRAAVFRPGETVLLIGTGLTMADITVAGTRAAAGKAVVHAISRHGLMPTSQRDFRPGPGVADALPTLRAAALSVRRVLRVSRKLAADIERAGGDWREAMNILRNAAPELWQRMPLRERRRFLRHLRARWDVLRHRLPKETLDTLDELRARGQLHVHAGKIVACKPIGEQMLVHWHARGEERLQTLRVDRIINCTGPDYDARRNRDPLLRSLLSERMAVADELHLGLKTGEFGGLIDANGQVSRALYYIGPMLRADHWETTAVPELRRHAELLAQHLLSSLVGTSAVREAAVR